jgi:hypothetical protein
MDSYRVPVMRFWTAAVRYAANVRLRLSTVLLRPLNLCRRLLVQGAHRSRTVTAPRSKLLEHRRGHPRASVTQGEHLAVVAATLTDSPHPDAKTLMSNDRMHHSTVPAMPSISRARDSCIRARPRKGDGGGSLDRICVGGLTGHAAILSRSKQSRTGSAKKGDPARLVLKNTIMLATSGLKVGHALPRWLSKKRRCATSRRPKAEQPADRMRARPSRPGRQS